MSRTPEVIIDTPKKIVNRVLLAGGWFFVAIGGIHFAAGNNGIIQLLIGAALLYAASCIKYKLVKTIEASGYKRA